MLRVHHLAILRATQDSLGAMKACPPQLFLVRCKLLRGAMVLTRLAGWAVVLQAHNFLCNRAQTFALMLPARALAHLPGFPTASARTAETMLAAAASMQISTGAAPAEAKVADMAEALDMTGAAAGDLQWMSTTLATCRRSAAAKASRS